MLPTIPTTILIGLACSSLVRASTANLNVSTTTLTQLGCDTMCQTYFEAGLAADVEMFGTSFDSDFYSTESNFTAETLNVSTGMTAYRFQYTTRDLHDTLIPFPVVAYAHGTIGVFTGYPPTTTTTTDLYDYHSWSLLIEDGYAVGAPDYAGLGNNATLHEYLSFPAHANDLYYAMVAARKALPHTFTSEWMSVGHSQGGGAVWKPSKSELVKTHGAGEYLGTVVLAPASRIYDMTVLTAETILTGSGFASYDATYEALWLPLALKRVIPGIDLSFFSDTFLQRNATAPANGGAADTPKLIVQGLEETAVLREITVRSFNASCLSGNKVHMSLVAGMDHTDVFTASSPGWLGFIRNRFARKSTSGRCSVIQRAPSDRANLVTEVESSEVTKSLM
ncbi:hypothetical protein BO82DRAFT_411843 [Aspergillus uvarum CBS 121591]|uniref:Alpha/beta-hydrolase n=1 Tax=Aspergillus uvarum CBS 121591 TaxID=1448315 RepID=A0A319DWP9_9EURO|nr:hypothetical protein BO82DRAFT_411843 [Aspergillus uvarum CBS 121591]PYH83332.1 hypothetical protein BO82DRAFT_411843 [Aspergillus uvarum CBS 121591]